ncbi:MAG: rod shape-determining protein MreC [Luteitalea sp.]|nr:rod shape-determining protein MreC [Luteitalea sp.]
MTAVALPEIRQRAGYLLLAVILGHVLLISAQVNSRSGVPILESVTFGVFAEVQRAASTLLGALSSGWADYVDLRRVKAENEVLKQQLSAVQIELQEQRALADRTLNLERLLDLRDRLALQTAAAGVIAAGATPEFRTLTIDKGTGQGLRADMAVIAPTGVVGRIVTPSRRASKVQLLIDRNAAAGALIERTRAQGVVVGGGDDRLRLEYVSEISDIAVGDVVVTSGIDGIYPKGFIIGQVETVLKNGSEYSEIIVRPSVDFSSIEEVLVVLTPTPAKEAVRETVK